MASRLLCNEELGEVQFLISWYPHMSGKLIFLAQVAGWAPLKLEDGKEKNASSLHLWLHGTQTSHEGTMVGLCCRKHRFKTPLPAPQEEALSSMTTTFSGASDQLSSQLSPCLYLAQKLDNVSLCKCHLRVLTYEFFAELHFDVACLEERKDEGDFYFLQRRTKAIILSGILRPSTSSLSSVIHYGEQ